MKQKDFAPKLTNWELTKFILFILFCPVIFIIYTIYLILQYGLNSYKLSTINKKIKKLLKEREKTGYISGIIIDKELFEELKENNGYKEI